MTFIDALRMLIQGYGIRRECWTPRTYIYPDQPFYTFSQIDVKANDWLYLDPIDGWRR